MRCSSGSAARRAAGATASTALMRSLGMRDSLMYGGYEVQHGSPRAIPVRVEEQPAFGIGKYTTAWDMASLHRAVWLACREQGPASQGRAGVHGRRRPVPPVASRPRSRHAEARPVRRLAPRCRSAAQGRLDLRGTTRHGPRVLAGRRVRRERHDVARRRGRNLVRRARRAVRRGCACAVSRRPG